MKKYLFSCLVLLSAFGVRAQDHVKCGADIVLQQQLQTEEARANYEALQDAMARYAADPRVPVTRENGVRIIPVVFHILHAGGSENISLAKVQQQMDVLNEDYRRLNPDTVNTPERFYGDTEYTHFVFNSDDLASYVDDSAYVQLYNVAGESFAFHFNDGSGALSDSLVDNFNNVIEVNISSSADTAELAMALADAIDAQDGLIANYSHETEFTDAPNFTVDGAEVASLNYTSEHTYTTSWNGSDTDTTYSDTLMVVLYEDAAEAFLPTDTLYVFDSDVTYDVFDGSGAVTGTNGFTSEGSLTLSYTSVLTFSGDYIVDVSTDDLGYVDDVLLAGLWNVTSTITQQGKYIPADSNIEFRLATKDPMGNCTDGVVRVFTSKTEGANDNTGFKAESYWNAYSYLNVWVVRNIGLNLDGGGTVLGYAQFPGTGLLSTDGIAVIASNIDVRSSGGRTATHEVGHWLGLRHVWGDAECGSDNVLDTPTAEGPNFGICGNNPAFLGQFGGGSQYHTTPYNVPGCDPSNPDGEMFMNYMDYSSDACMNLFTLGQKAIMDFSFYGDGTEPGLRASVISQENLELTGTADPYTVLDCAPISDFYFDQSGDFAIQKMICEGENIRFDESAYNGDVDDYLWTFEGGDPATDDDDNPIITYNTPGVYDVTLEVSNTVGSNSKTANDMVIVSSNNAQYQNDWGYVDSFWDEQAFNDDYVIFNQDASNNKWEWYSADGGGSTGWESVRMFNLGNSLEEIDEMITPSYDLSSINSPTLKFRFSGAATNSSPDDELRIMASDDCGESWSTRETLSGFELVNSGLVAGSYRPNGNSTWTDVSVGLGSFGSRSNVRIKFRWVSGGASNNFYVDDITIASSPLGMEDLERQIDLNIAPNPTISTTTVSMNLPEDADVKMEIVDVLGKDVNPIYANNLSNGTHRFDIDMSSYSAGIYYLRISIDNDMLMKKIIKN
mgnify:CR=1 FL=1